ncbi:MarR family winged helix-turn-helix transcriptional regulator [Fibrella aquatilis]|uniref:Winged helix DNA-binding protein n=1 Tax=Fibrella aquatilis TaxID=2817059 RepID=A0A939G5T4_9BACT|nr:winged helix DNA-binding protein [Fibrella aquatilis]MBO0931154.1 winged helix DNA-binding protein [Fibrella aquatilis]
MDSGEEKLVELVNAWAAYSSVHDQADLPGFCLHYLTEQAKPVPLPTQHHHPILNSDVAPDAAIPTGEEAGQHQPKTQWVESLTERKNKSIATSRHIRPEAHLASLTGRLASYAHFYSKKAMQPIGFKSIEDPVYLIVLAQMGTPKKSELIYEMMAEFASGIDVINRLVKMELIEEFPDEQDRRSKRLLLTNKGITVIQETFPVMDKVADVAYSSLSEGEKTLLVQILQKLDKYHADHYRPNRTADFDTVYERMVAAQG